MSARIVFVSGDHEYGSESTMPLLARQMEAYGFETLHLPATPDQNAEENIPGLEALDQADLAIFYLRWRRLPTAQLQPIERYLASKKPLIGFRTSTHAFRYPEDHPSAGWNAFGEFALGGPPGWAGPHGHTHYGHDSRTLVRVIPEKATHPVLQGVDPEFEVRSWLYHVLPDYPVPGSECLLTGEAIDPNKPAIENPVLWTWQRASKGQVLCSTLGHPEDFDHPAMQRLCVNAIHWSLGRQEWKWLGPQAYEVPYHGIRK